MAKAQGCRFVKKQGGIRSKRRQATPMVVRGHQNVHTSSSSALSTSKKVLNMSDI
jgi:hypothetical protein